MKREQYLKEFEKSIRRMFELTSMKNADYADGEDAFQNFRNVEQLGLCSVEVGILTRMTDKLQRLANLSKREAQVKTESFADTAFDLAVYSLILKIYAEHKDANEMSEPKLDVVEITAKCFTCTREFRTKIISPTDLVVCPQCGSHDVFIIGSNEDSKPR